MLSGLISSWREPKMCGNRTRPFEAGRIIDGGLECQSSNRPDARNRHHPHANLVVGGCTFDASIQLQEVLMQNETCIEERQQGMCQDIINLDHRSNNPVKAAVLYALGQAYPEYLQQPANLVGQINRFVQQCFASA